MTALQQQLAGLGVAIDAETARRLLVFLDELLRWNQKLNLTAVRDRDEAVEKHLVDSLTLLPLLPETTRLLDLGSGGGLPGIPLSIVLPQLQVVSVDAVAKKIHFQRHAARLLGLTRFTALHARVEALAQQADHRQGYDVVVARAFSALSNLAVLAAPLLRPGGRLFAMKGPEGGQELTAAAAELVRQGLVHRQTATLTLPVSGAARSLLVLEKV